MSGDMHDLLIRMADELDNYRQLLTDDRREVHALASEARAALSRWGRPAAPPADLPPDYIDEWITNPRDRALLEVFHKACNAEGGSADEVILRGLKAVLQDGLSRSHRLQQENHRFREPERTILCDILANGTLLPDPDGTRYGIPPAPLEGEVGELVAALRSTADGLESQAYPQTAALITRAADLLSQQAAPAPAVVPVAIPGEQWHEDDGACLWWRFPIEEPPWAGDPREDDWPGYHTHFTRIVCPVLPAPQGGEVEG